MANNPYVNKVQLADGTSLIDISSDTVTADKLMQGYTAHDRTGALITGTATGGSGSGVVWQDAQGYVHLSDEGDIPLQTKSVSPSETAQTVTPDAGYYALDKVNVGAISSTYVGSDITRRSSTDLTASGATVTVPSGYYSAQASKAVASGSATPASTISATGATVTTGTNTLTLSKSVSNTPTVSAGYISSGTAGNSSVSLTASINTRSSSDLTVSGATVTAPAGYYASSASKSVSAMTLPQFMSSTSSGTFINGLQGTDTVKYLNIPQGYNETAQYYQISAASGTAGTPTATKGTVSNHSVSVTPSVTNTTGYITGSTKTGTAVTVTASELASGNKAITQNGSNIDVVGYSTVSVDVPSSTPTIQSLTVTPSTSQQTFNASGVDGYKPVTVNAMPSGTAGTPTATKGAVSNHSVTVTPSVTNTTGYITGSTKTGTAVTVTASELASGNKAITQNGTGIDVVGYSTVSVDVQGGGGSTNIVSGDFTAGTEGTVQTINIPYTGTGYIVSLMISVDGGLRGDYFYNVPHQYACGLFCGLKYYATQAPDYTTNNVNYNGLTVSATIKGSSGTTYSSTGTGSSGSTVAYTTADPSASSVTSIVRITSKNVIKVVISASNSGYGFLSGAKYNYVVVYSE